MKKVLILGGGFAGIQAAISLQKTKKFDITLISDRDYFYIYPISIWIPVGLINFEDVKVPLLETKNKYGFNLIIDEVKQINSNQNKVVCNSGSFSYDYLIVAMGADKVQHKGLENTLSICGDPNMSIDLKTKLDDILSKPNGNISVGFGGNPTDKSAVRGGPAFELIFNIHNLLKKRKIRNNFELNFFAPMDSPGARMGKSALKMMDKMFKKYKINKAFGKKIKEFTKDEVVFQDDTKLKTDLTIFIAGLSGHSVLKDSDLQTTEAGFLDIDDNCLVKGTNNVFGVGDSAAIQGYDWIAKQGHIAMLMAKNAAYNILQIENNKSIRKGYKKHLNIICLMDIGNGAALVFRNNKKEFVIPMPIVGHYLKRAFGWYIKKLLK